MGQMGGGDSRPTQSGESVAGHLRYGGGRRESIRRSRSEVQRKQSQTQFPRKRSTPPATTPTTTTTTITAKLSLQPNSHCKFSHNSATAAAAAANGKPSTNAAILHGTKLPRLLRLLSAVAKSTHKLVRTDGAVNSNGFIVIVFFFIVIFCIWSLLLCFILLLLRFISTTFR